MQKTTKIIIGVVIAIIIIAGIWYGGSRKPTEEEVIKIGAILPLTGSASDYGEEQLNGIKLAISETPSIRNRKITLFVEDSKNDPKEGISAFRNLIDIKKVDFLLGTMSSVGLALKNQVIEEKIPTIWIAAHPDLVKNNPWMFRNLPTASQYVEAVIKSIEREGIKKIGLFYLNDDMGASIKSSFVELFIGEITDMEMFNKDGNDFRTEITKLLATKPDSIFISGYGTATGLLIKQLREKGYDGNIFGPGEISSTNTQQAAGDAINGVIFSDYSPDYTSGAGKIFRDKYFAFIGKEPGPDSVLGYEEAKILFHAIDNTSGGREEVKEFLSTLKDYPGFSGPISIKNNEIQLSLVIRKLVNGEKVLLYEE